ncbi:MAG: LytTR family DNA-binding domain-containing protein [Bacteroidota bacterium]
MREVIKKINQLLQVPLGFPTQRRVKRQIIGMVTVFPPAFILLFTPFGLQDYAGTTGIWVYVVIISYGLLSGLLTHLYLNYVPRWVGIRPHQFPIRSAFGYYGSFFMFLGSLNYLLTWSLEGWVGFSGYDWYLIVMRTLLIGIIPLSLVVSWSVYQQRIKESEAKVESPSPSSPLHITLQSDLQHERVQVHLDRLLYIESEGNYCEMFTMAEGGKHEKTLVRSTLLGLEKQLVGTSVMRCHRSYLVNLKKVTQLTGNSRGMELHLADTATRVPVSRSKIDQVKAALG